MTLVPTATVPPPHKVTPDPLPAALHTVNGWQRTINDNNLKTRLPFSLQVVSFFLFLTNVLAHKLVTALKVKDETP